MANKKVTVDQLAAEITKTLKDFEGVTEEACVRGVLETANEAVKELRGAKPNPPNTWKTYDSGWKVKKESKSRGKGLFAIVGNEKYYRLTHLLEKGHALKRGGRKIGDTRAFEHIAPVAERAEADLVKNIRKGIENG